MDVIPILLLIAVIAAVILIFKFISNLTKAILYAFLFLLIVTLILGVFVYLDVKDLKQNFGVLPKTMIAVDSNNVLTGMKLIDMDLTKQAPEYLSDSKLSSYTEFYQKKDYKSIKEDSYKLILFNISVFEKSNRIIEIQNEEVESKDFVIFLKEGNLGSFAGVDVESLNEAERQKMKAAAFGLLIADKIENEGMIFMARSMKNREIIIYPETITFKIVKYLPVSFMEKAASKIIKKE